MNINPLNQINLFCLENEINELMHLNMINKLPQKILLSGPKGIGKSTLAFHFINYVLSKGEPYEYNKDELKIHSENKSFKLIQNGVNPNFELIDINKDKKSIDLIQIRKLISNLQKLSFNDKKRFVLINNIELLNENSINALLKIIEEPSKNVHFILINNNKHILPTLISRCLNFKISLTNEKSIKILENLLGENIFDNINNELLDYYFTPGNIYRLILFAKKNDLDLKNISLLEFLKIIIEENLYKKDNSINDLIFNFIELYLRKKTNPRDLYFLNLYSYFVQKIDHFKKYNLDEESLLFEFKLKALNG